MNVEVTKDEVKILESSDLPNENEYKITTCYFTFDEFTSSFQVKRAIFTILSTGEMYEIDIINNECDIPIEVLKKEYERVKIGVYGYNIGENEELLNRFSPSYDEFIVPTGSYEEGALSPEPITPSQYDLYSQALQQGLNEVDDKLQEVDDTVSQKISEMDQKIDETDEAITRAERLNIEASKSGKITTITVTKQDGSTESEDILDGADGENGVGLQYDWEGTSLGIKREDEALFKYVNLEGKKGDPGAINLLIVNELPLVGSEDTLYFVPKEDTEESDLYDEYVWINNDWELIGEKQITVDLTNYYTKTEVNNLIPTKLSQLSSDVTHRVVTDSEKTTWNNKSDFSGNYNDLSNKPTIPTSTSQLTNNSNFVSDSAYVHTDNNYTDNEKNKLADLENYDDTEVKESITDLNNSIITIGKIKADKTSIPKNTSDLNNDSGYITKNVNDLTYYTLKTSTGSLIDLEINQTTYVVTLKLKDIDGNLISSDSIDLPLENVVVSGSYDDSSQKIVLTLQNGTTVDIPVGDLVAGLQTEITSSNKIASDLVDDSNGGNKFVTTSEKSTWNGKQNAITSSNKLSASLVSGLATVATSGSYNDLSNKPTIPTQVTESTVSGWGFTKNTGTITGVKMNGTTVASSGVADLGTVITEHQDISGKQDKIVAGTNISIASDGKTISATDTTYNNATTSVAGLMSSDDKTKLDGIETGATKNLNYYGTCATAAATQAKVVVCDGFVLENGATISVLFTYAQTYNGTPTLNVNSTGAKNIRYKADTNAVRYIWSAGEIIDFTYNGTYWVMHRSALATTSYYGLAKYSDSLVSTSSALGATPKAINTAMINIISGTPVYSTSSTYAVGDRVRYSNNVWECITAITTAEAWKEAHWQEVAPLQEQIDDKQDLLVSGTNIKTINNQSILGSGNITIEGGGSGTVDTAMSDSSTNAVQNRVIKSYVDDTIKANYIDVRINDSPIVSDNIANISVTGSYNETGSPLLSLQDVMIDDSIPLGPDENSIRINTTSGNYDGTSVLLATNDTLKSEYVPIAADAAMQGTNYSSSINNVGYQIQFGLTNNTSGDSNSIVLTPTETYIGNVKDPQNDTDAANKLYVDSLVGDIGTILDSINGEVIGG